MANTYDFYKPKLDSEYPEVDGPLSITTYLSALDASYSRYREKTAKAFKYNPDNTSRDPKCLFSLDSVDYPIFLSPYGKLVQKGHGRLLYNDFLSKPTLPKFANVPDAESLLNMSNAASLTDKVVEKTFMALAGAQHKAAVLPSMHCAKRCGNMYTASLYSGLVSLLSNVPSAELQGKRVGLFSYGSGLASSLFRSASLVAEMSNSGFMVTKAKTAWPVISSCEPTTAVSATPLWRMSADSTSAVDNR